MNITFYLLALPTRCLDIEGILVDGRSMLVAGCTSILFSRQKYLFELCLIHKLKLNLSTVLRQKIYKTTEKVEAKVKTHSRYFNQPLSVLRCYNLYLIHLTTF